MKKQYLRVRIALLTLALGLASVNFFNWANDYFGKPPIELPRIENVSPIEVFIINRRIGNNNVFNIKDRNAFSATGHGCGGKNKYGGESSVTAYNAYNWQTVGTNTIYYDNIKDAKREFNLRTQEALQILEPTRFFGKKRKNKQRIVLENEHKWIDIVIYDSNHCLDIISAPSLKLALEFEEWDKYHSN